MKNKKENKGEEEKGYIALIVGTSEGVRQCDG